MLDRAGGSNTALFRFSTTDLRWQQHSAGAWVSGKFMVSVGSDIYVFGGVVRRGCAMMVIVWMHAR
jgi:hypothetical protein